MNKADAHFRVGVCLYYLLYLFMLYSVIATNKAAHIASLSALYSLTLTCILVNIDTKGGSVYAENKLYRAVYDGISV